MSARGLCFGVAFLAFAVASVAGAGSTSVTPQSFQSVTRGEKETTIRFTAAGDKVFGTAVIAERAVDAQALDFLLPQAAQAQIDNVNFNRRFLIGVYLSDGKSGYRVTITKVGLARLSPTRRQFCVTAAVTTPPAGAPETGHVWLQTHVVSISARRFPVVPKNWVLRTTSGKLLNISVFSNDSGTYTRKTGVPSACPR